MHPLFHFFDWYCNYIFVASLGIISLTLCLCACPHIHCSLILLQYSREGMRLPQLMRRLMVIGWWVLTRIWNWPEVNIAFNRLTDPFWKKIEIWWNRNRRWKRTLFKCFNGLFNDYSLNRICHLNPLRPT